MRAGISHQLYATCHFELLYLIIKQIFQVGGVFSVLYKEQQPMEGQKRQLYVN